MYNKALIKLNESEFEEINHQYTYQIKDLISAEIYGLLENHTMEKKSYESALKILERKIQEDPDDSRFHSSLGIAYAGLGKKEDAGIFLNLSSLKNTQALWLGSTNVNLLNSLCFLKTSSTTFEMNEFI